uniref:Putative polya rna polymerase mitochondrial-like protein n=1 Tax=Culex tarsalis TaxID=7177 RepID=A0A1Q3G0I5_CULTA
MAHLHLQLLAARFNDLADDYLRRVGWLAEPAVASLQALQRSIDGMGGLRCFRSLRSLPFDDVQLGKEILHFDRPVVCCKRVLRCTETLIAHFLSDCHADGALEDETKRTAILFNLYVQAVGHVLVRYCKQYEQVDQFTLDCLRKGRDYLSCILRKPIRGDAAVVGTYVRTNFWKWKYVFDYSCGHCSMEDYEECEFSGAIAWFKIFTNSLKINPIRHLESKMHINTIRTLQPDQMIPTREEINNNPNWKHPKAAAFLHHVREVDLHKLEETGARLARQTPLKEVMTFLTNHLSLPLGGIKIEFFGSRVMGLAEPGSDVDIRITSLAGLKEDQAHAITLDWAKHCPDLTFISMIPAAPWLVRAHHKSLNIDLDLSFGNAYVVANAKLIKYLFGLQPTARPMYFLLKKWKHQTELSQNFHTHVLIMLLVFYMQTRKYLPTIRSIINGPQKLKNGSFNTNFRTTFEATTFPGHLPMLTRGFFEFYKNFDWTANGTCAFDGVIRPKSAFAIAGGRKSMPPMMCSDFFDQSRNVAANIARPDYEKFMMACAEASEILEARRSFF